MTVVSTATAPIIPNKAASVTTAPAEGWTGASGFSARKYRATGVIANAARAQAGAATEAANNNADNGSASRAREASAIASGLDCALTTNKSAAAHPAPIATINRCNMTSAVPRWFAVRRRTVRLQLAPRPVWPNAAVRSSRGGETARTQSADHVRQEAQEPGALDRLCELALLAGAHRGDARRHNLAALGDVARQETGVLIVD